MPRKWIPIPIESKWFQNVQESALTTAQAAMENAYLNEAGGWSRFPGLADFVTLPGGDVGRVYLFDWQGSLMGVSSATGKLYSVDVATGVATDVTGVPISGNNRAIFTKTDTDLLIARGGPIIAYDGTPTRVLSDDAPDSTHVGFVDNFTVAIEKDSQRFVHSTPGDNAAWDPLDTFSASGQPDNLNALLITDFREMLLIGPDSIEQFERITTGTVPFFRRWSVGEGIIAPYTIIGVDNAAFGLNKHLEFVRLSGQTSEPRSLDIGRLIEGWNEDEDPTPIDLTDAWVGGFPNLPLDIMGQKFILLQAPFADNPYGTKGLTFIYDFRQQRWFTLYAWDTELGLPTRWPGWSYWAINGVYYVGGEGKIYKLTQASFTHAGEIQRMYGRTAPLSNLGEIRIDNFRCRLRRGTGGNSDATFQIRATRDGRRKTRWVKRSLGKAGERESVIEFGNLGSGHVWQIEFMITDDAPVELVKMEAQVTNLGE